MQIARSHEILCLKKLGQCTAHASPDRALYVKVETVDRYKGAYVSHVSLNILSYALRRAFRWSLKVKVAAQSYPSRSSIPPPTCFAVFGVGAVGRGTGLDAAGAPHMDASDLAFAMSASFGP